MLDYSVLLDEFIIGYIAVVVGAVIISIFIRLLNN